MKRAAAAVLFAALLGCHDNDDEDAAIAAALSKIFPVAESEPNNDAPTADALSSSSAGTGTIAPGDADFWTFEASAGQAIQIEIFGTRFDQAAWNAAIAIPLLRLFAADGTTELVREDNTVWNFGTHDLDLVTYRILTAGRHYLRLTSSGATGGKYAFVLRTITLANVQVEAEPVATSGVNDTAGTAEPIVPGVMQAWRVDNEFDYYSFVVPAGAHLVTFEMITYRNGVYAADTDNYDPIIELFDTDGTTSLQSDDDCYFYDSSVQYLFTVAGTYFLQVREFGGTADGFYLLRFSMESLTPSAEVEANDTTGTATNTAYGGIVAGNGGGADADFWSFDGVAGDMVRITTFDSGNRQGSTATVSTDILEPDGVTVAPSVAGSVLRVTRTILQQAGRHFIRITGAAGTDYVLKLALFKRTAYESEANNSEFLAEALDTTGAGVIGTAGDVDFFRFEAEEGELVRVNVYASTSGGFSDGDFEHSGHGSTLDPRLRVFSSAMSLLAQANTLGSVSAQGTADALPRATVTFIAPATGTYYLVVSAASGGGSATDYYVVERK